MSRLKKLELYLWWLYFYLVELGGPNDWEPWQRAVTPFGLTACAIAGAATGWALAKALG